MTWTILRSSLILPAGAIVGGGVGIIASVVLAVWQILNGQPPDFFILFAAFELSIGIGLGAIWGGVVAIVDSVSSRRARAARILATCGTAVIVGCVLVAAALYFQWPSLTSGRSILLAVVVGAISSVALLAVAMAISSRIRRA